MTAKEFTIALKHLTPHISQFSEFPLDFAENYISQLNIERKSSFTRINQEDSVIDLVVNYNVSQLSIGIFSFYNEIKENDMFIIFGAREAFPVAISKLTKEIVELDWADENRIVSYIAKSQDCYLDLLIDIEKLNQKQLFGAITPLNWKSQINNLYIVAGGTKYKAHLEDL